MNVFKINKITFLVLIGILFSCTEAYELKTENFESLLVVEATITDELKPQEIRLSKTFRLESEEPNQVSNAQVYIETSGGIQYNFAQTTPGLYTSVAAFQAESGENYTLHVTLSDGSSYVSTPEVLPPSTAIQSLTPVLETINGVQGIQVYANSNTTVDEATYFKYDYEETYKISVPEYSTLNLNLINVGQVNGGIFYELELVPKSEDVRTCYSSKKSTAIIQTSLNDSQNTSVQQFPVRFIPSTDGIIRERYSILVTQNVQSLEAYNFYKILKELGTIENLFTDNQPGFIQGNMSSTLNEQENVIGFFQVTSVSSKRIYFNYGDFNIPKPSFLYDCLFYEDLDYNDNTTQDGDRNDYSLLYSVLSSGTYKYLEGEHPLYTLVSVQCADCTSFSSTVIPEFWED